MIIDAHNHPDWHGHDLGRFLDNMDRNGIGTCWLLSWECPPDELDPFAYNHTLSFVGEEAPIGFSRVLSYGERAPDRFVLGYAPDPRRPDAIDRLEAAVSIYGVKVYGELKLRMMYDNPDAIRMYRACARLRPRRAQEGKPRLLGQRGRDRGHVGPHEQHRDQHRVLARGRRRALHEMGEHRLVGRDRRAARVPARQRPARVAHGQIEEVLEQAQRVARRPRAKPQGQVVPDLRLPLGPREPQPQMPDQKRLGGREHREIGDDAAAAGLRVVKAHFRCVLRSVAARSVRRG